MFSRALKNQDFFIVLLFQDYCYITSPSSRVIFFPPMAISQYWVNWWKKLKIANLWLIRVVLSALDMRFLFVCIYVCVCVCVSLCVCMYVCMCVYMYIFFIYYFNFSFHWKILTQYIFVFTELWPVLSHGWPV